MRWRQQFGKPIFSFERISGKIVMMAAEILAARQLTYFAARRKEMNARCDLEAGMAKLLAARVAWAAADNGPKFTAATVLRLNIRSAACCAMPAFSIFLKGRRKFRPILLPAASCQLNKNQKPKNVKRKNHGCGQLYDSSWAGGGHRRFARRAVEHVAQRQCQHSQKLMRWRVGLQFATVVLVMLGFYLSGR